MDPKQQFKVGLCIKLAELGVTPGEFINGLSKQAMDPVDLFGRLAGSIAGTGQSALSTGMDLGVGGLKTLGQAALIAPAALGAAAGVATEKMESPDPAAVDSVQKAELIGMYRRLSREIRNRKATHNSERVV